MRISEIYRASQGEGVWMGTPTVIVRLSECNLHCHFCDSNFTWYTGTEMQVGEVFDKIIKESEKSNEVIGFRMLTGGEPLLQQNEILKLLDMDESGKYEVETNGTKQPKEELVDKIFWWNVSPKLKSSGEDYSKRIKGDILEYFNKLYNSSFKFVVKDESDFVEMLRIMDCYELNREKIIVMPEGKTKSLMSSRSKWLAKVCIEHNLRFMIRLQIYLWGNQRGK